MFEILVCLFKAKIKEINVAKYIYEIKKKFSGPLGQF